MEKHTHTHTQTCTYTHTHTNRLAQCTNTNVKKKKSNLDSGIGPYASFPHFGPIWSYVEFDSFFVTRERHTAYEQNHQYDVGKDGGEIGDFPRRLWA